MNGAAWLVRPEREAEEHPDQAIDALNLKPGMQIVDLGSGVGYMTLRMAKKVGPTGRVYGVDLQPGMLDKLRDNAKAAGVTNITPFSANLPIRSTCRANRSGVDGRRLS
ncbi:MAG: methyltransferase domain-containing protein [Acidobacteriota bacterium]